MFLLLVLNWLFAYVQVSTLICFIRCTVVSRTFLSWFKMFPNLFIFVFCCMLLFSVVGVSNCFGSSGATVLFTFVWGGFKWFSVIFKGFLCF